MVHQIVPGYGRGNVRVQFCWVLQGTREWMQRLNKPLCACNNKGSPSALGGGGSVHLAIINMSVLSGILDFSWALVNVNVTGHCYVSQ